MFYYLSKIIPMEDRHTFIHSQHHGCWCSGDVGGLGISIHGTHLSLPKYSSFGSYNVMIVDVYWSALCLVQVAKPLISVSRVKKTFKWGRHNECDCVSKHRRLDGLLNHLFGRRTKKSSKLRVTGLCEGNSPMTGEFPSQRASNAKNVDDVAVGQESSTFELNLNWIWIWMTADCR